MCLSLGDRSLYVLIGTLHALPRGACPGHQRTTDIIPRAPRLCRSARETPIRFTSPTRHLIVFYSREFMRGSGGENVGAFFSPTLPSSYPLSISLACLSPQSSQPRGLHRNARASSYLRRGRRLCFYFGLFVRLHAALWNYRRMSLGWDSVTNKSSLRNSSRIVQFCGWQHDRSRSAYCGVL